MEGVNEEGRKHFAGETTFAAQRRIGHLVEERLNRTIRERSGIIIAPRRLPEYIDAALKEEILKGQ